MSEIILTRQVTEEVPKDRWIASLSNGETVFEDEIKGQLPAWERLAQYIRQQKISITNLRLQVAGQEISLPSKQEGYIQKKRMQSTGGRSVLSKCIGYAQSGQSMIVMAGNDMSSETRYEPDPGPPVTIYRHDIECTRKCCAVS